MNIHPAGDPLRAAPQPIRRLLGTAAGALMLAACAGGSGVSSAPQPQAGTGPAAAAPAALAASGLDTLTEPLVIRSDANGVLDATIAAVWRPLYVEGKDSTWMLRTYQVRKANGIDYGSSGPVGFPGPTFRMKAGDSVHIVLINEMEPVDSDTSCIAYPAVTNGVDHFQDCFHGANWTNIHYHGMHVTPASNGDDVLLLIPPDSTYEYGFRIPANQSAGTHWYHPHKHGSVAIQVLNGMSGAFIVEGGPLDSLANRHRMREHMIAVQMIAREPNLMSGVFGQNTLVNGQATPVIVMAPGEVQRWRIVNENVTKTANFRISVADSAGTEPVFFDIARDGVAYADTNYSPNGMPVRDTAIIMAPGNRLDLFVQAPMNGGIFAIQGTPIAHDDAQDRTRKDSLRHGNLGAALRERAQRQRTTSTVAATTKPLFYVQVDPTRQPNGSTLPMSLPELPGFLANLPGTMNPQTILANPAQLPVIVFADSGFGSQSHQQPATFYVGTARNPYMQFNSDSVYVPRNAANTPLPMVLDSVQTWMVVNRSPATNHPFHIHINPFQVIDVYYPDPADPNIPLYVQLDSAAQSRNAPVWLDVLPLPVPLITVLAADTTVSGGVTTITVTDADTVPGYALIRQGYEPFRNADGSICTDCGPAYGQFVMHCHILGHEERGMMQVIEIVPVAGGMPGAVRTSSTPGAGGHAGHGASPVSAASPPQSHQHRH